MNPSENTIDASTNRRTGTQGPRVAAHREGPESDDASHEGWLAEPQLSDPIRRENERDKRSG
jgi:hypothetical protein